MVIQARTVEVNLGETVRLYHHELHKKHLKRSYILKLQTENGLLEGHAACASYLEQQVKDLLLQPAPIDQIARNTLLAEIQENDFTDDDNDMLLATPTSKEVREIVSSSNLMAAPGTDGIPSLLYSTCWDVMGGPLTEVVKAIYQGENPTKSMQTSIMVFGSKPKKPNSLKPGDKRRISLLNSDYKVVTG